MFKKTFVFGNDTKQIAPDAKSVIKKNKFSFRKQSIRAKFVSY